MKKQSQIFDSTRFSNCLKRDFVLDGRGLLLKGLVLIAILTLLLYAVMRPDKYNYAFYENEQGGASYMIFALCSFLVLSIGASQFSQNMTSSGKRLNTLMSPCSTLEKYICRWLIYVVGVTIMFLVSFAIAEGLRVLIIKAYYGDIPGLHYVSISEYPLRDGEFGLFCLWILAVQATFVLGSTIAPKNAFLKTAGVNVLICVAFSIAISCTYKLTMHPGYVPSQESETILIYLTRGFPICWTIFCYITAYFRMKESEIIERL